MKRKALVAGLALAGVSAPASAQGLQEDARCILLSNVFAKASKDESAQRLARQIGVFYLGRLDGRVEPKALAEALQREAKAFDGKTAGQAMDACKARLVAAQTTVNDISRSLVPAGKVP